MNRLKRRAIALLASIGFGVSVLPAKSDAALIEFSDATFALNAYSISTFSNLAAIDTPVVTQKLSGGNPGPFVAIEGTLHTAPGDTIFAAGFLNSSWIYSPSNQGVPLNISFSLDRFNTAATTDTSIAATLGASQGGTYYFISFQGPVVAGVWESIGTTSVSLTTGWSAFNFLSGSISPAVHPDFSATGAPITFGFAMSVQPGINDVTGLIGVDNVSIAISAVPEPSSVATLLAGFALLVLLCPALVAPLWRSDIQNSMPYSSRWRLAGVNR